MFPCTLQRLDIGQSHTLAGRPALGGLQTEYLRGVYISKPKRYCNFEARQLRRVTAQRTRLLEGRTRLFEVTPLPSGIGKPIPGCGTLHPFLLLGFLSQAIFCCTQGLARTSLFNSELGSNIPKRVAAGIGAALRSHDPVLSIGHALD